MKPNRTIKVYILLIVVALLTGMGCSGTPESQIQDRNKLLLISFDGFRHDYLSKTETPNFDEFIAGGVTSNGLIPIMPSKTFPNHYTIVTGLYPENSGLIGNTMYDPLWDKWFRINDRQAVENGEWYQGEPIWNTAEKQGLTTGTMFWIGSEADIQGMRPTYWKKYDGGMAERARIDTVVSWFKKEENPIDLGTLYFELVDSRGHEFGTTSDSLVATIEKSDRLLGYLKKRLQEEHLWDPMNIIVLSDHGMVDLSADRTIVLDSIINMNQVKWQIIGPVTMLQPESGKVDQVYNQLLQAGEHYRVYKKEELPTRYHLKNHRRVMDIVLVADMPYTVLTSDYKEQFIESLPQGTHGYDDNNEEMHALFAARELLLKLVILWPHSRISMFMN